MEFFSGPSGEFVQHVAEIGEGFDVIELAGLDHGVKGCRPFATGVIAGEELILATDGYAPQCALHAVVVDTKQITHPHVRFQSQPAQHDSRETSLLKVCAASLSPSTIVR